MIILQPSFYAKSRILTSVHTRAVLRLCSEPPVTKRTGDLGTAAGGAAGRLAQGDGGQLGISADTTSKYKRTAVGQYFLRLKHHSC